MELTRAEKNQMIEEIKKFYMEERGEEIGNLAGEIILDFITKSLGKFYYNAGIRDAKKYIFTKLEEISELEEY